MKRTKPYKHTPISIASRKAKGRNLQKWVMQQISDILNMECGKDALISSREMGQSGTDVRLIGKALEQFPFAVECKAQEKINLGEWIKQAKSNSKRGVDWLLVMKQKFNEPVVVIDAERFFTFYKILHSKLYDK